MAASAAGTTGRRCRPGWRLSAPGSGAVATDSGVLLFSNSVGRTQNLMHLTVTPDGLASAWQTQNFAAIGFDNNDPLTAAPQNGFSRTVTAAISTLENDYFQGTMSVMPILSVPLPATGLTPGSTYHVVIHQIGGDLNDYVEVAFLQENCLPLNAKSATPGSGGPWTTVSGSYELPIQVFDQTPGGKILHTWEDSGARITSLITAQAGSQLLGLCEATQFADGSWLAAVSEIEYGGMVPAGVTQLASPGPLPPKPRPAQRAGKARPPCRPSGRRTGRPHCVDDRHDEQQGDTDKEFDSWGHSRHVTCDLDKGAT